MEDSGRPVVFLPPLLPTPRSDTRLHFSTDYVVNLERFGALLFERGGTPAWELDPFPRRLLCVLQLTDNWEHAWRIAAAVPGGSAFVPAVEHLRTMGVLVETPSEKSAAPVSSADAAAAIAREMVASQSRLGLRPRRS